MNITRLDELCAKEKKSTASKSEKKEFKDLMSDLFAEEGLSETALLYQKKGLAFCGAEPVLDYILQLKPEQHKEAIRTAFCSQVFSSNESSCAFKLGMSLLAYAINKRASDRVIYTLFVFLPSRTINNKKKPINDAVTITEKHFLCILDDDAVLPQIDTTSNNQKVIREFSIMMLNILGQIEPGKKVSADKLNNVKKWAASGNTISNTVEVVGGKAPVVSDNSKSLGQEKAEKQDNTPRQEPAKPINDTSLEEYRAEFDNMFASITATIKRAKRDKQEIEHLREENALLESRLKSEGEIAAKYKSSCDMIAMEADSLKRELIELREKVKNQEEERRIYQEQIERLKSVTEIYADDKKNSMDAALKSVAARLKSEYKDYLDAADMEMTKELGENMRCQLETVFRILKKNGINVED